MEFNKSTIHTYPSGTHIHAKFNDVVEMPNKSGKMVQLGEGYSWSWGILQYELPNKTTLYLSV